MTGTDPSIPGVQRLPAPSSAFPWLSAMWVAVITGVVYAISAAHNVSARVDVIETSRAKQAETQTADDRETRDRLIRIETTLELVARKVGADEGAKGGE